MPGRTWGQGRYSSAESESEDLDASAGHTQCKCAYTCTLIYTLIKWRNRGQNNSTAGWVFALYAADPGSIPSTPFSSLNAVRSNSWVQNREHCQVWLKDKTKTDTKTEKAKKWRLTFNKIAFYGNSNTRNEWVTKRKITLSCLCPIPSRKD